MSLKYALIGCGRISPNHIAAAQDNNLEIVAICDIDVTKMDEISDKFKLSNNIHRYVDYKDMVKNEKLDLIAICTESGKHGEIALNCIEEGINLIIEKPIALSLEEADEIIFRAKEKNIKVCACHQNRFNKSIQKIRQAYEENRFGKLLHGTAHIRWNRGKDYYIQAPWRGTWEQDGGALMNQCIHNIDLLIWMMGEEVTEVIGITDNLIHDFIEAEDVGLALLKFSNGSYGIVEGTTNIYPRNLEETLYIFGEKGTVKAGGKSVNLIEEWQFADEIDNSEEIKAKYNENPPNVYGYGHKPLYTDMIDAIINDRKPYITAEDGRRVLEVVLAIYKSAAEDKKIKLPLNKCSTMEFKGRFDR
ncbi:Gfo/Idh/MocA family oxidoreductase [Mobilitalea sibirica]|uniref:Gfo/Idh/MocA family oxidoreductase n=1 Tax=Mobilitalea sibirica TaxID=1462919 RepID=A0A8J7HC55_9FIRM|nr:Gfo/Idh/MocA family oxidoreductase [Mobilitalea sibirica]MBH1942050.1 Gfo/Idh/MocA family oxidoreductase [Mobilitalea sibirica]